MKRIIGAIGVLLIASACGQGGSAEPSLQTTTTVDVAAEMSDRSTPSTTEPRPAMTLQSPDFGDGSAIPARFTCDGEDVSPELDVSFAPPGTQTLAVVIRDPDAPLGVWHHWVEYDIPVDDIDSIVLPEDVASLGTQGLNSWKVPGYGGPCPPEGQSHRYVFSVYAVDDDLDLPGSLDANTLTAALEGHTLAEVILVGTYAR